jgi:hypothetical protein
LYPRILQLKSPTVQEHIEKEDAMHACYYSSAWVQTIKKRLQTAQMGRVPSSAVGSFPEASTTALKTKAKSNNTVEISWISIGRNNSEMLRTGASLEIRLGISFLTA